MLQQTSLTQTLVAPRGTPATPGEASIGVGSRWKHVAEVLQLPTDMQSFLVFLAAIFVLAASMALHVHLSSQSMGKREQLAELEVEYQQIQRLNAELVWQINQQATLDEAYIKAIEMGYEPMLERKFVIGSDTIVKRLLEDDATVLAQP